MAIRIVQLGSPRAQGEGLRLGTVRRPPRGVPKAEFASRDYYDTWLPQLSPTAELMAEGRAAEDEKSWAAFRKKFIAQMNDADTARLLDLLAGLSHTSSFSVGCYCDEESRCHRGILRELLAQRGAKIA